MTIKQIYEIKNNQLIINLPEGFKNQQKVLVTIDEIKNNKAEKIALLKLAANDPQFLADMEEVNSDFDVIDNETL
jgi:hypothetical protein